MAQMHYPGFWSRVVARGAAYLALMLGVSALAYLAAGVWPRPVTLLVVCTGSLAAAILLSIAIQRQREAERALARRATALEDALQQIQNELDAHDRDRAELRRSEARLAAVLNTAVDGIFTVDSQGVILSANLAAARIFGYNQGELEGRPITDIMPEPYRTRHPL